MIAPADRHADDCPPLAWRTGLVLLAAALLLNLWWVTRAWHESLRDGHEFRQVQTALTAHYFKTEGIKLDYETPVLGPPWAIPMEFPTYQAVVAALARLTGWPLEQCGRAVGIFFLYAGLPALFLVLRQWGLSRLAALCAVAATLTAPLYAFYARTFLIETTALCFALWFLWGFQHGLAGRRWTGGAVALAAGGLAILTKVTTFGVFALPALVAGLLQAHRERRAGKSWREVALTLAWCAAIAAAIGALGASWVRYSDALKAANPYAGFLTSAGLHEWNLGTPGQRLDPEFWSGIYTITSRFIVSEPALLVLIAGLPLLAGGARRRALACVAFGSAGFLIFANLYFVHDYYHCASAIFLTSALGISVAGVLQDGRLPAAARVLLAVAAIVVAQAAAFTRSYGGFYERQNPRPPVLAEIVRTTTQAEDVVLAFGLDWNGLLPYYSERRAIMVPHNRIDDVGALHRSLAQLGERRVGAMVLAGTLKNSPYFIRPRLQLLDLEPLPIAETETMALYLRKDLHERALGLLRGHQYPEVRLTLERRPPPPDMKEEHSLESAEWRDQLAPLFQPAPYLYRSIYPLAVNTLRGQPILGTHAPTEIYFRPPPGARRIVARGGLVPAAYSDGNVTDGIVIQVLEEFPSGARRVLHERTLRPIEVPTDRDEAVIEVDSDRVFEGSIILRIDPGSMGNVNFDWAYWRSVRIE